MDCEREAHTMQSEDTLRRPCSHTLRKCSRVFRQALRTKLVQMASYENEPWSLGPIRLYSFNHGFASSVHY